MTHDERAYNSYVAYCLSVLVRPLGFEAWYLTVEEINPGDARSFAQFHGYADDVGTPGFSTNNYPETRSEMRRSFVQNFDELTKVYEDNGGFVFP